MGSEPLQRTRAAEGRGGGRTEAGDTCASRPLGQQRLRASVQPKTKRVCKLNTNKNHNHKAV